MSQIFKDISTMPNEKMPEGPYLSFDFNDNPAVQAAIMCKIVGGVIFVVNEEYTKGEWHT